MEKNPEKLYFSAIDDVYRFMDRMPSFQVSGSSAVRPGLDRIRQFCDMIGQPEKKVPCIHIAGTNGKGTTAALLALTFQNAGYRCALYTSPHLETIRERFRINRQMIPEPELLLFFQQHIDKVLSCSLSYFELTTAIAFWWFSRQKVDMAILETGLGGRLDATNIVYPELSVITSIGHDHQSFLGNNLADIAAEKAGIIKRGCPVVIGDLPARAYQTVLAIARENKSEVWDARTLRPVYEVFDESDPESNKGLAGEPDYQHRRGISGVCHLHSVHGRISIPADFAAPVQRWNVAVSYLAVLISRKKKHAIDLHAFFEAVRYAGESGLMPGRFEQLIPGREWYFDGAHNPQAVRALMNTLRIRFAGRQPIAVLSLMKDKAKKKYLEPFSVFKKNYYYLMQMERAANISQITPHLPKIHCLPGNEEDLIRFFNELAEEVVIFTGSFYFYSVVKRWMYQIIKA